MTATKTTHILRPISPRDVGTLCEIDSLATSTYWPRWSEDDYRASMKEANTIGLACERDGCIDGVLLYHLEAKRIQIVRLLVHPLRQWHGVGAAFVARLIGKLSPNHRCEVTAEVPERLSGTLKFLASQGFLAHRVERGAYDGDDLFCMKYSVAPERPAFVNRISGNWEA